MNANVNAFGILFPEKPNAYGSFSSTQTQNVTQNTPLPVSHDTQDITPKNIYASLPSTDIYVRNKGVYKVLSSLQCNKTSGGGAGDLEMFITINGTPVPNSTTRIQINQNQEVVMTVEWFLELEANDYVRIVLFSATTGLQALAIPSAGIPAIPSIITTIMRID
jgi:hypothetical protein